MCILSSNQNRTNIEEESKKSWSFFRRVAVEPLLARLNKLAPLSGRLLLVLSDSGTGLIELNGAQQRHAKPLFTNVDVPFTNICQEMHNQVLGPDVERSCTQWNIVLFQATK